MIEKLYLASERPNAPPLRVGILLDSLSVVRPFGVVIDHLLAAPFVRLELLVTNDSGPVAPPPPPAWTRLLPSKLRTALRPDVRPHLLYTLYEKFDERTNPAEAALLHSIDYGPKLRDIPTIAVKPQAKRFVHRFPEEAIAQIREYDLDVMLRFGFNILRGDILKCARYGVWSYHHGDNDYYRGGPAHFWEMAEGNPVSGVILQVLSEELDAGLVLTKAIAPTRSNVSLARNRVTPYATGDTFVIRKLWELHSFGYEHLREHSIPPAPYQGRQKIYRRPSNMQMARIVLPSAGRVVRSRLTGAASKVFHWRFGIRKQAREPFSANRFNPSGFRWVEPPRGHFYADPFAITHKGEDWVLFEDYSYASNKGIISAAPVLDDGSIGPVQPALQLPGHLSYPFLWRQDGELFMIPECSSKKSVDLYRCTRFPDQWKHERTLFEGSAVDTTVLEHDGLLWFFLSLQDLPASAQLFLFSAPSLFHDWTYHPSNPISLDIHTARCGGEIFSHQSALVRPAQDGSVRYGYALRFQKITRLNPKEYAEEPFAVLLPDQIPGYPSLKGVHTYNRCQSFELLDAQTAEALATVS